MRRCRSARRRNYINYISDKATSVGGGVLEALAMLTDVFRG